ncbi:MAG: ACT domain-containing protein [Rhodothermales bacterium]
MHLTLLPEPMAVCRLPPDAPLPAGVLDAPFCSVTRTTDELSIVLEARRAQAGWKAELGWRMFKVAGPMDFELTGVVAGLTVPLADAGLPVFVVSTFDTDYLLVRSDRLDAAIATLRNAGHEVDG